MAKFLDSEGLLYFWGKIKAWVEAKGYTTNTGTITSVKTTAGTHTAINKTSGAAEFNVPTKTSHLQNDAGFLTSYTETDPVFTASPAHGITAEDISNWNSGEANVVKSVNTTAGTSGVNLSLSNAGELDVTVSSGTVTSGNSNFVTGGTVYSTTSTLAPKASPALTGTPTAPTAAAGTNTTQIATTEYVTTAVANAEVIASVDTTAGTSGINLSLDANKKLDVTISSGSIASGNSNFVTGGTVYSTTSLLAPKASPALTGTPTAPTATAGTNTTQIATTAFVTSAIATASAGLASFQGTVDAASTITGAAYKKGWYWVVQTAGTYVGQTCEVGDMIFAIKDKGSAYAAADFSVVQNNMDMQAITNTEIDTITAA